MLKLCVLSAVVLFSTTSLAQSNSGYYRSNASWYGPGLYGNHLGCGGTLTTSTWGVAHKTLPCGTKIRICYNRCVTATVIDRGPYVYGRDLDLTFPVKSAIGMPSTGVVRWQVIR